MANAAVVMLSDDNFQGEVLQSQKPVLVDFWATWCGPCLRIAPIIDELAKEFEGKAVVAKLDVDQASATASEYGVSSIPTLIVFKGGQEVERIVGALPKTAIAKAVSKHL
ncbi:MAG: thioredoxin [Candidatus Sumerlaeia bacterium]|nr:thioredoxin [Candidatus Sumerlaeia bacterium]